MPNAKIEFKADVIEEIILQYLDKVPLIDNKVQPKISIDTKNMVFDIKVAFHHSNYGVYTTLTEIQDLLYFELKAIFDCDKLTINVGAL